MTRPDSVPQAIWDTLTPEARICIDAVIGRLEQRISDLEARLNQNSTNSSRPPSTDPPGLKRRPPTPSAGRNRGGQPGHRRSVRPMVAPEKLASVTPCKPSTCRRCRHPLQGDDPDPLVHQVAEWPVVEPVVHEYRRHRLRCPGCGQTTCGPLPPGVPAGAFGPRLQATLSLLSGAYRLSKRQVQQLAGDLLGLRIAVGMIAKLERNTAATLETPVEELRTTVLEAPVVHIDETSWRQDRKKAWCWVTATARATVFTIAGTRAGSVARKLLGIGRRQVVISDRFPGYDWIAVGERQVCWAHLRRDFQAMIDRGGASEPIGRELLAASNRLFRWWHRVRDGTLRRRTFARLVDQLKAGVRRALARGVRCGHGRTEGTCMELSKVEPAFWTFVEVADVEPTNNTAERALRHAVIWRRVSGGTDSQDGSRFVERMLTAVATCRQQGRDVLHYLTDCFEACLSGEKIPSLLPDSPGSRVANPGL